MANGYLPTGISAQPIDIAGAGQRLMQAAVEQKLADIEQGLAMADESQKAALEAMSMKTIQGLDRQLQDRYSDQFDQHRQKIVDMLSKSGGVLNRQQQMQIRNEQEDIINQTMADNEVMKQFEETAKFFRDPNAKYGYNVPAALQELRRQQKAFEKGEYSGDPRTIIMKHQLEAPVAGYISNRYKDDIDSLGKESWGDFQGNVFSSTEVSGLYAQNPDAVEKAIRVRDQIMQDPNVVRRYTANDGTVFEDRRADIQKRVEDAISKKISESKPYRQTTSSGSDRYKNVVDYTPSKFTYGDKEYNVVRVPSDVSQTERNFFIDSATNLDTGEKTQLTQDNAQLVSYDVDKGVILFRGKGGKAESDGQPLYIREGSVPSKSNGKWSGASTEAGLNKKDYTDLLKAEYKGKRPIDKVKDISFDKDADGNITVSGVLEVDNEWWGTGATDVPVKIKYVTFSDPASEALFEADMQSNKEALANMFTKVAVNGKPLEQYFDNPPTKEEKTSTNEVERRTKDGKIAIFDAKTQKFIRYKE